jgi:DNA repair exonuclease SbcCD nuclease subunit
MPRLLFTADHHIGNHGRFGGPARGGINVRGRMAIAVTRSAHELARRLGCIAHVVCGDLFDSSRPSPPLITKTAKALSGGPEAIVLVGNHDYHSGESDDTATSPLALCDTIRLVEQASVLELDGAELWAVPYAIVDGRGPADLLTITLGELAKGRPQRPAQPRVLVLHMGIGDEGTPEHLRATTGWVAADDIQEACQTHEIRWVFAGDWHHPQVWRPGLRGDHTRPGIATIVQCGTLCPTGFGDDGFERGRAWLLDLDAGTLEQHVIEGPRFVRAESVDTLDLPDEAGTIYVEVTTTAERMPAERAAVEQLAKSGVISAGSVRVDKKDVQAATRRAASRARDRRGMLEAASEYVAAMALEPGADRAQVREIVLAHLRAS